MTKISLLINIFVGMIFPSFLVIVLQLTCGVPLALWYIILFGFVVYGSIGWMMIYLHKKK